MDRATAFTPTAPLCLSGKHLAGAVSSSTVQWRVARPSPRSRTRPSCPTCVLAEKTTNSTEAQASNDSTVTREDVVTVAFVAHIDHGKSSMCDALLRASKCFRDNEVIQERALDSGDLERERGITINASAASLIYNGVNVQILDSMCCYPPRCSRASAVSNTRFLLAAPGHADFGGEVERVLNMTDGVLLLVDSVEGPKPQTRFVLKKAIELGKKIALIINKMDRDNARPEFVVDATFDLMAELGASDEQMDFRIAYASAIKGESGAEVASITDNMDAIFDLIMGFPRPKVSLTAPLQLQVNNVTYDDFKGRLASGRIEAGTLRRGMAVVVAHPEKETRRGRVAEILMYDKLGQQCIDEAKAGDIVLVSGLTEFEIGDTICAPDAVKTLAPIKVEEPTVRMSLAVNQSEFAGQEGKYVTSRNIRDRLEKELERNVGLRMDSERSAADSFEVCGRGALHLTILIETMRREGYEMMVGPPTVITKMVDGVKHEPFEIFEVECPEEYVGTVVDLLSRRRGEMTNMGGLNAENMSSVTYQIPTRGLLGVKNALLTATRGTAVMNSQFAGYKPWAGDLEEKENGSLLAFSTGKATSYGLEGAQDRGRLIIKPGEKVYKNQICGIHQRPGDLAVNICKMKQLTNHRSANKDVAKGMQGLLEFSLDDAIEYLGLDEVAEVTPLSVRLSKRPGYGDKRKKR